MLANQTGDYFGRTKTEIDVFTVAEVLKTMSFCARFIRCQSDEILLAAHLTDSGRDSCCLDQLLMIRLAETMGRT